jgi:hypothetical protein
MIPGYSQVRQTVSEIGEVGSPARLPFTIMLCCVAACLVVFASAVRDEAAKAGHSRLAADMVGFGAVSIAGGGIFAFPDPLHHVFGLSELVGYQTPLAMALTWRADPSGRRIIAFSSVMFVIVWIGMVLNLTALHRSGAIGTFVKPHYGVVQSALFASWLIWCGGIGVLLWQQGGNSVPRPG